MHIILAKANNYTIPTNSHRISNKHVIHHVPYSGKVWQGECLVNLLFSSIWQKKVWRMSRSAKGLLIVTTTLNGFSLANCKRFAIFAKLSTRQTFPLYGT